ncbi:histidine phosphatase superfamily [Phialemonium atrogriseum]|uniref:3-phytase n=1 Tax=Phialemonium atrogriseum TaxID=1093897 RepID=A0AAJ0C2K2_9PEZI|nr:histidine phosphatase superfamily [Phialemonium atrogriseum]KAK1767542.1 histidine phosphatase superfamily [Phialemonium atrogriseum]
MAPLSMLAALVGTAAVVAGYTPNKPGSSGRYPMNAPYDQSFQDGYSILKHLGGYGPYVNRAAYGIGRDPPEGCAVDQVMMLRRHGERYPLVGDSENMLKTLEKLYGSKVSSWRDDLEFLNRWQFFIPDLGYVELESEAGPYSGLLGSYKHGAEYRVRYGHLWDQKPNSTVPMFTSDYERVIQTARKFGEGFFGWNYSTSAALNIISESGKMGANSLTPYCPKDNDTSVCNNLSRYMPQFDVAAARLGRQNPGLELDSTDVFNLMQMAAFELNVRGYSDWVDVFTMDEWVSFGYTQDLQFYYCAGPGDKNMKAVGAVYANATLHLLNQGPKKAGSIFWSFAHDTNITPILAALGISSPAEDLPLHHIPFPNPYSIGDIMPMGGHLTLERMACNETAVTKRDTYVRIVLNEAVVPFTGCQDGPGFSCSLANYTSLVTKMLPDYTSTCGVDASYPQYLSFFWDYNTTTTNNFETRTYIPYQGA